MDLSNFLEWLAEWTRTQILSVVFGIVCGLVIGWLFHKRQFREVKKRLDALETNKSDGIERGHQEINIGPQFYFSGEPASGEDRPVISKSIRRIETLTQEEMDALPVKEKGTLYITGEK